MHDEQPLDKAVNEARPQAESGPVAVRQAEAHYNQADLIDRLARVYKLFWEAGVRDGLVSPLCEHDTTSGDAS